MAISKDNKRVILTIPADLLEKVKEKAAEENRSVSNMIVTLLKRELEES